MKLIALSAQEYPVSLSQNAEYVQRRLTEIAFTLKEIKEQVDTISRMVAREEMTPEILFADVHFMTALEKKNVLRDWQRFIRNGYSGVSFTSRLYDHLSIHSGYIAHYNRAGFYNTYWRGEISSFAKNRNLIVRPVPRSFINWVSFLAQFTIDPEYRDLNSAMMFNLRTELVSLQKELENEVVGHFQLAIRNRTNLANLKKESMEKRVASLQQEIGTLSAEIRTMNPEAFIDQEAIRYQGLFPSINPESFTLKKLAGNLF